MAHADLKHMGNQRALVPEQLVVGRQIVVAGIAGLEMPAALVGAVFAGRARRAALACALVPYAMSATVVTMASASGEVSN